MDCTDSFKKVNLPLTTESEVAKQNGYCFDPASGYISGVETFGEQVSAVLTFEHCWERL